MGLYRYEAGKVILVAGKEQLEFPDVRAITQSAEGSATPGSLVTLKYDATGGSQGNFGAIQLDGPGSNTYQSEIQKGSSSVVCAQDVTTCTDTSSPCTGSICPSQTGNMVGSTRSGVDYRITNTDPHCDTFAEVFSGPVNGKFTLNALCNPWLGGSYTSLRVVMVPIVAGLCNGNCDLTITGFALFWLEGYGSGGCTGNSCEITGRFVNADLTTNALAGVYSAVRSGIATGVRFLWIPNLARPDALLALTVAALTGAASWQAGTMCQFA